MCAGDLRGSPLKTQFSLFSRLFFTLAARVRNEFVSRVRDFRKFCARTRATLNYSQEL